jgi:hypothetical protein
MEIIASLLQLQQTIEAQQMLVSEMKKQMETQKQDIIIQQNEPERPTKPDIDQKPEKPLPKTYSREYHQKYYTDKYKQVLDDRYKKNREELLKKANERYRMKKEEEYKKSHNGSLDGFGSEKIKKVLRKKLRKIKCVFYLRKIKYMICIYSIHTIMSTSTDIRISFPTGKRVIHPRIQAHKLLKPKQHGFDMQAWQEKMRRIRKEVAEEKKQETLDKQRKKREDEERLSRDEYWKRYNEIKEQQHLPRNEIKTKIEAERKGRLQQRKRKEHAKQLVNMKSAQEKFKGKPTITRITIDMKPLNDLVERVEDFGFDKIEYRYGYDYHLGVLAQYVKETLRTAQLPIKFGLLYKAKY